MEIYMTCILQILSFSSPFRRFEMENFLRRPTMVAHNISLLIATTLPLKLTAQTNNSAL